MEAPGRAGVTVEPHGLVSGKPHEMSVIAARGWQWVATLSDAAEVERPGSESGCAVMLAVMVNAGA